MNAWQERFAKKMAKVRGAANDRCEQFAQDVLEPLFAEFAEFASRQGLRTATPMSEPGVRTFRFAMGENTYALVAFRSDGLEHCELTAEFAVSRHKRVEPTAAKTESVAADQAWARKFFESTLDKFAEAIADAFADQGTLVGV